jgi:transcriptional regulator with XRE-family HTH domain
MPETLHLQAWRIARRHTAESLAAAAGLSPETIETIESGAHDPPLSVIGRLGTALGVPPGWLFHHPSHLDLLLTDAEGDPIDAGNSVDPVFDRLLRAARDERELFVLLTTLLQRGDSKLLRAAEMSLRSLLKQAKSTTVPWGSRQPGHFEPPAD